jgi:hypothetical protein
VDGSIVVFTFVSFLITAQINPDEPSAVASWVRVVFMDVPFRGGEAYTLGVTPSTA